MPNCREVTRLVSEGLDRELPFLSRLSLRLHLVMCGGCRRFARQLRFLHEAVRQHVAAGQPADAAVLSAEAKERIRQRLEEEKF